MWAFCSSCDHGLPIDIPGDVAPLPLVDASTDMHKSVGDKMRDFSL